MALTLIEQAKLVNDPLQAGIIEVFPQTSPILQFMPFMNVNHRSYTYNQEDTLPGIAFRDFGEDYDEDTGVVNPVTEYLRIFGGHSDVDRALVKTSGDLNDIRASHDRMKAKAAALFFTKNFIKSENSSLDTEFDGLQARLTGNQLIAAGDTPEGDQLTLSKLDELIDAIVGTPDILLMNKTMRRKVNALMRAAGAAIETVSDQFGKQIPGYAGIPIGVIEEDNEGNEILAFDEDDATGDTDPSAECTSIYAVRFGEREYLSGIQAGALDVIDHGLYSGGVAYRTTIEWIAGIALFHPKCAARLYGIKKPV
jgi:hypothetical protein